VINKHARGVRLAARLAGMALLCAGLMGRPTSTHSAAAESTQRYVNQSGNNITGCGTLVTSPCATVSYLLPFVNAGDQINLAGVITDNFTLTRGVTIAGQAGAIINGNGARVMTVNAGVSATVSNLTLQNGGGAQDGGLVYNAGTLAINNTTLTQGNVQGANGGAIFNAGTLTVTGSTIANNRAEFGGGIENQGVLFVSTSAILGNQASYGGGIDNAVSGEVHLSRAVLMNNTAPSAGAGIYNDIGMSARMWITETAIVSNTAPNDAAGIFNGGQLSIFNSTISNNRSNAGQGAAINHYSGILLLRHATVAGNAVVNRTGASAVHFAGAATIERSVFANDGVDNCSGVVSSSGFNHSSDATCAFNQPTDITSTSARLGPLRPASGAWNTYTQAPGPASPIVNRVPSASCGAASDQRGVARPQDGACDIGAHEAVPIDLSLTAQSSQASVPAGMPVTVSMTISNAGPGSATGVAVTGDLPAGTTLGGCTGAAACVASGNRLTATLGALNAGAASALAIQLKPQGSGNNTFAFNVAGAEWDRQDANNSAGVSVDVQTSADLSILLSAPVNVMTGAVFTITAEVENRSAFMADAPSFTLTVPATTTLVSASGNLWACAPNASQMACQYAQGLPPNGRSAPVFIVLQSGNTPATLQIVGHVTSPTFDPEPGNNTSNRNLVVDRGFKVAAPLVMR
jgi:hypothetical protein